MPALLPAIITLWAAAYLIGAIPPSYLLGRAFGGIDLRRHGSGNIGSSNFASQLGKRWFAAIMAIDMTRGAAPVLIGHYLLSISEHPWLLTLTPLFTLVGNAWSPFLRFTGGRSVGVWAGGLAALSPSLFLAALLAYLCVWLTTRRSPESLLPIMLLLPLAALAWPEGWILAISSQQYSVYAAAGAVLILLKRLLSNGDPIPADLTRRSVMLNRLLRDRDVADRRQWLSRTHSTDLNAPSRHSCAPSRPSSPHSCEKTACPVLDTRSPRT